MEPRYDGVQLYLCGGSYVRYRRACEDVFRRMAEPGATVGMMVAAANERGLEIGFRLERNEAATPPGSED